MDLVDIIPNDLEVESGSEGSDIDAEELIDEFEEEFDEGNDAFEVDNVVVPDVNDAVDGAPGGPPAGGAPIDWTDQLAAVPNVPFTGKISLLVHNNGVFNYIHHLESV
jgi:hypothetical protein